jgi:hypothetical protein
VGELHFYVTGRRYKSEEEEDEEEEEEEEEEPEAECRAEHYIYCEG